VGWFGKLFGQHDAGAASPAEPPDLFDRYSELSSLERRPVLEAFLTNLAQSIEGGTMVAKPNDHKTEVHCRPGGFPVRILGEEGNGCNELTLTLRLPSPYGNMILLCDPTVDQTKERPDEWSDTTRIFFAKSIFIEVPTQGRDLKTGNGAEMLFRKQAERFAVLPEATRQRVLAMMTTQTTLGITGGDIRGWLQRTWIKAAPFKQQTLELLALMVEVASVIPSVPVISDMPDMPPHIAAAMAGMQGMQGVPVATPALQTGMRLVRCPYCLANFFLDSRATCVHCGAPFAE
jgi:hypothetical protein